MKGSATDEMGEVSKSLFSLLQLLGRDTGTFSYGDMATFVGRVFLRFLAIVLPNADTNSQQLIRVALINEMSNWNKV